MSSATSDADRQIGPYRVLQLLGEGGAARTWAANDPRVDAPLAVKELQLLKSAHPKQIELFERECAILRELEHPQIPTFIQTIVERHSETLSLYLVQERIVGQSLQQLLDLGIRFDAADVVAFMRSSLAPLSYLHERTPPLYHRDIKPSNVIVRVDGTCVLIDFGAVREALADPRTGGSSVVGTFGYMAPEQFQARAWAATDLYGLGATAIHLLTGIEPGRFEIRRLKPDFHGTIDTDPHLAAILDLLLEPNVEDRYASAEALRRALDRWEARHGDGRTDAERLRDALERADRAVAAGTRAAKRGPGSAGDAFERSSLARGGDPQPPLVEALEDGTLSVDNPSATATSAPLMSASMAPTFGELVQGPHESLASTVNATRAAPVATDDPRGPQRAGSTTTAEPNSEAATGSDPVAAGAEAHAADAPATPTPTRQAETAPAAVPSNAPLTRPSVPVEKDFVGPLGLLTPGELGANIAGLYVMVTGVAILAWAVMSQLEYNARSWMAVGAGMATLGLVQAVWPRRPVGRSREDLRRSGSTAAVRLTRIRRRVSHVGATEWVIDYEYEASDGLHYANSYRVASAETARRVADAPDQIVVRYAADDPSWSILVVRP